MTAMQKLADLKLDYLAMEDPAFAVDPFPHFARARAAHPWLADCAHGKVVHNYSAIKDLLSQDHSMVGAYTDVVDIMGARGTSWGRFQQESLLGSSGEKHARMRRVLAPAFTPQQAKKHRGLMTQRRV
jgi:cytochrome P450